MVERTELNLVSKHIGVLIFITDNDWSTEDQLDENIRGAMQVILS